MTTLVEEAVELKPCPFCGVQIGITLGGYLGHPNIPTDCPGGRIILRPQDAEALSRWNTRVAALPTDDDVERVARALCEMHIRKVRKWDTPADELDAKMPEYVDYSWADFVPEASAAIHTLIGRE